MVFLVMIDYYYTSRILSIRLPKQKTSEEYINMTSKKQ